MRQDVRMTHRVALEELVDLLRCRRGKVLHLTQKSRMVGRLGLLFDSVSNLIKRALSGYVST